MLTTEVVQLFVVYHHQGIQQWTVDPCSDSTLTRISDNHRSARKMWILTSSPKHDDWRKPPNVRAASWFYHWACSWVMLTYVNFCWLSDDLIMDLWMNYMSFVMLHEGLWCCMMPYADIRVVPLRLAEICFLMWYSVMGLSFKWAFGLLFRQPKTRKFIELPKSKAFWEKLLLKDVYFPSCVPKESTTKKERRMNLIRLKIFFLKASEKIPQLLADFFSDLSGCFRK